MLVGASDGLRFSVDEEVAARIAVSNFRGRVRARGVQSQVDDDGVRSMVVRLDDERATDVAIDPETGAVTSWRNRTWRLFDALWSIHVLGYLDRRSPANWPLRVVAFAAALAASSGAALLLSRFTIRAHKENTDGLP